MNQTTSVLIFLSLASAMVGGGHYYLYRRLVVGPQLPKAWRRIVAGTLATLAIGLLLSLGLNRILPLSVSRVVTIPFFVWLGPMFLLFVTFLVVDLGRLGHAATRLAIGNHQVDEDRRLFVTRTVTGAASAGVLGTTGYGVYHAMGELVVSPITVSLKRLPVALNGFRIAQISDLHIGPTRTGQWLEQVVKRVNALDADIVAITGDLVDGSVEKLASDVAPLAHLRSKKGVFFVTGNHEYYSGAVAWVEELGRLGIRVLRNERVNVGNETDSFDLAGVDDYRSGGMAPGHGHDVAAAVGGRDDQRELVLLAHQPRTIFDAAKYGVGLMLCGHTHGGQIWPIQHISELINIYVKGLHKHGKTWIYVNSGTGFWGPPLRIASTAEITLITLISSKSANEPR